MARATRKDLKGRTFERLVVVRLHHVDDRQRAHWLCKCECGKHVVVASRYLLANETRSCGCLRHDVAKARIGMMHALTSHPIAPFAPA